ncbi:hypothetical protein LEMLEM_LOCUS43, partial [Lemmus lemmus]
VGQPDWEQLEWSVSPARQVLCVPQVQKPQETSIGSPSPLYIHRTFFWGNYAEKCRSFPNNRENLSLGCLASVSIGVSGHHKPVTKYRSMIYTQEFCVDWPEVSLTTRPCAGTGESQPFSLEWAKYPTGKPNNLQVYFSPFTLNSCNIQESWDAGRIKEV